MVFTVQILPANPATIVGSFGLVYVYKSLTISVCLQYTIAMMGYGPEDKTAVLELTYNYGVTEYDKGNAYAQVKSKFRYREREVAIVSNL